MCYLKSIKQLSVNQQYQVRIMSENKQHIHPLLIEKNRRWIGAIEKSIEGLDPHKQKLLMQDAGRDCAKDIWALCEKTLGCSIQSVEDLIKGWNLVRKNRKLNGEWVVEGNDVHGVFEECGCPLVRSGLVELQPAQCWCSHNMMETIFSKVSNSSASVEIIRSIGRGDNVCEFRITF